jgi:histidinol phosphatase-like PHP family hydrolase
MHSIFSDGELIPAELVRRAVVAGYQAMAITDHGDQSNVDFIIPCIVKFCKKVSDMQAIRVIPGIELTHVCPDNIFELAKDCRRLGAQIILVHGETIVEPVMGGTNTAALQSPIDILAHPGLITEEEARLAAAHMIRLEVTTRKGHSLTNGHVVKMAREAKAPLVLNTDSHAPGDLVGKDMAMRIATGAGMSTLEIDQMFQNSECLVKEILQTK